MTITSTRGIAVVCLTAAVLALASCRESERDRVLTFEPGTYKGEPDRPLSEDQVEALRQRAANQRFQ